MVTILGVMFLIAWAGVLLWSVARIAIAAVRGQPWPPSFYVVGLIGSCALSAGLVLAIKNSLPNDTFGAGFVFAATGSVLIWSLGIALYNSRDDRNADQHREANMRMVDALEWD